MNFGALIIGDEIISGKRTDQHFSTLIGLLAKRGLRLAWAQYLDDRRKTITRALTSSLAAGDTVFCFGGIGNTPDDQTRQAAADALNVPLVLHPDAEREIRARFGDQTDGNRLLLGTFPKGVSILPNPFNRIPGFYTHHHYFMPGFPQMAHPMADWVLETFYSSVFKRSVDKAFLLTGENAYESGLLDLMERIVNEYPALRLFSLPSVKDTGERAHIELGVEGDEALVDQAMESIRQEIEKRNIRWAWRK